MLKTLDILKFQSLDNLSQLPKTSNYHYNYLIGIVMLYITLSILSGLSVYKLILLGLFLLPVGIFTTPLTYCLSNVITEVYGYPVARNLMWWFVFCSTIFTGLSYLLINLPSPASFKHQAAYDLILGSMPRIYIAGIIGTIVGINLKFSWKENIIGSEVLYQLPEEKLLII